nr:hypothetical protein [Tanacetum cinerariifolium]
LFNQEGKLVDSNESKSKSDYSNDDNACCSKHMTGNLKLLVNFVWKFMGTVCFGNDHVAAILGFGDLQNLEGVDLLKGDRSTNLYTINIHEMASASPICLMARASSTKSWVFQSSNTIRNIFVLPVSKEKSKRASHPPKPVPNSRQRLHLLHMDLCGPKRISSINGKRYILVIVDDYSRYTWVHFLRSKYEVPEVIIKFLKIITVLLQSPVIIIRTDNSIEFKKQVLKEYFDTIGIFHQMSSVQTPQQNGVVERQNRTLVEAPRTMLIFSRAPLFLWAEAIATNDREDIRKLGAKGDIGFSLGILLVPVLTDSKPGLQSMTSGHISSGLDLTYAPSTITMQQPSEDKLDLLFEAMYDDYIGGQPSATARTIPPVQEPQVHQSAATASSL